MVVEEKCGWGVRRRVVGRREVAIIGGGRGKWKMKVKKICIYEKIAVSLHANFGNKRKCT